MSNAGNFLGKPFRHNRGAGNDAARPNNYFLKGAKRMGQAIGIDFGTTNTVVSYKNKRGNLKQLDYNGHILIPSVIYFKTKDNYLIGYSARNNLATNPAACVENFKSKLC